MSIKERQSLVAALRILATAAEGAGEVGLDRVLSAYNYVHRQLDGHAIIMPVFPKYEFTYNAAIQMMTMTGAR